MDLFVLPACIIAQIDKFYQLSTITSKNNITFSKPLAKEQSTEMSRNSQTAGTIVTVLPDPLYNCVGANSEK